MQEIHPILLLLPLPGLGPPLASDFDAISVSLTVLNEIAGAPEIPAPGLHYFFPSLQSMIVSFISDPFYLRPLEAGTAIAHMTARAQGQSARHLRRGQSMTAA